MLTKSGYYKKNVENCNMWRILTNEVLSLCGYWKQKNTMNDKQYLQLVTNKLKTIAVAKIFSLLFIKFIIPFFNYFIYINPDIIIFFYLVPFACISSIYYPFNQIVMICSWCDKAWRFLSFKTNFTKWIFQNLLG